MIRFFFSNLQKKIADFFYFSEKNFLKILLVFFILSLVLNFIFLQRTPLVEDALEYFQKSIEIGRGNFVPLEHRSLGWSFILSLFLAPKFNLSIETKMLVAKTVSLLFASATIFPLALILRKILTTKETMVTLFLFIFSAHLLSTSSSVNSEPAFIFFILWSLYFLYRAVEKGFYLYLSIFFASVSYFIRPNGLLVFVAILASLIFLLKKGTLFNWKTLSVSIVLFFLFCAPFLFQRFYYFGSPFHFGLNSRFYADNYSQAISATGSEGTSFFNYYTSHDMHDFTEKFIYHGLFSILSFLLIYIITPFSIALSCSNILSGNWFNFLLIIYGIFSIISLIVSAKGFFLKFKDKNFIPFYIFFVVFIFGLIPVWDVYGTARYLFPVLPLSLTFMSVGLVHFAGLRKNGDLGLLLFLLVFVILSLLKPIGLIFLS